MIKILAFAFLPFFMAIGIVTESSVELADVESSEITWKGYKVTGSHEGTIDLKNANLEFDEAGTLTGGDVIIDMTSLKTTDLSGRSAEKLEGHLKSDDFFSVEKHPTAILKITSVAPKGTPGDFKINGDLTIKGKTNPIKFYANIMEKDGSKVATANLKIDRTEYDVQYGSGSFFSNLGDKTIYDEFDINVKLVLK